MRVFFTTVYVAGPRISEASRLETRDIDVARGGIHVRNSAEVFFGRVAAGHAVRQEALDTAYGAAHAGRVPNGPPRAALPHMPVDINPLEALATSVDAETLASTKPQAPETDGVPHCDGIAEGDHIDDAAARGAG